MNEVSVAAPFLVLRNGAVLFLGHGEDIGELAVQRFDDATQVVAVQAAYFVFIVAVDNMILDAGTLCEIVSADAISIQIFS
jgi:hypothetical protein